MNQYSNIFTIYNIFLSLCYKSIISVNNPELVKLGSVLKVLGITIGNYFAIPGNFIMTCCLPSLLWVVGVS